MGPGDKKNAVGPVDELDHVLEVELVEAEILNLDEVSGFLQQAEGNGLAPRGGHGGNTDIDILAVDAHTDASIHGQALLGDIQVGHDLDTGNDGGLEFVQLRGNVDLVQHSVDAVPDAQLVFHWLDVNIRRALTVCLGDDLVHELDDGSVGIFRIHVELGDGGHVIVHGIAAVANHLVDGVRADAVILLDGFFDFRAG